MTKTKRILGISDSKSVFVPEWQPPEFFELIVSLAQGECPRICYVGAARGDDPNRTAEFFELASRTNCDPYALKFFNMTTDNPEEYFKGADLIFIDGGATRNLIALMREWNAIDALIEAYHSGTFIVGASAGISMLFDWCISDSVRTHIAPVRGIGILRGTVCAHYDVHAERRKVLSTLIEAEGTALPAFGLCDGVAVLFENGKSKAVFSARNDGFLHVFSPAAENTMHQTIKAARINDLVGADETLDLSLE